MSVVAVTGLAGSLGNRLLSLFEDDPSIARVIGVDAAEHVSGTSKLEFHQMDVRDPSMAKILVGSDVVVHAAFRSDAERDAAELRSHNVDGARNVIESAAATGARKIVVLSTGTVYGARPDNDVPLTEDSPLRPNEDYDVARHALEVEGIVEAVRRDHPDLVITVLRVAPVIGGEPHGFFARMLHAPRPLRVRGYAPPVQVAHTDDVANAIASAVAHDLDGAFNVASDGWVSALEFEALAGTRPVEIPEGVAFVTAERLQRLGVTFAPPGELHHVMHPWVLDTSKLRAAGWAPAHSTRDALAEAIADSRRFVGIGRARIRKETLMKGAAATLAAALAVRLVRRGRR